MTQFPAPSPLPPLNIPPSDAVVTVSIIDNTSYIKGIPTSFFFEPSIKGYDVLDCPAYNFLIEHDASGKKLLFDLGIAKDWRSGPPIIANLIIQNGWQLDAPKDVSDILTEHDVPLESISSIIWSHYHFDHTGDPSLFPPTTSLTVGPGFKKVLTPGYPTNPAAPILESAYKGRELVEISFDRSPELLLGRFRAFDYFGDGSFYLIDAPGHAVGHICGLARTTPDTFVFMGGDACHHVGELRPTQYLPLPEHITPNPFKQQSAPCPGSILLDVHHCHSATEPFYKIAEGIFHENSPEAQKSIRKLEEFDGHPNILTVIAHDETLLDILDFYPKHMNDWHSKGHKNRGMWEFVRDFKEEVKMD